VLDGKEMREIDPMEEKVGQSVWSSCPHSLLLRDPSFFLIALIVLIVSREV